MEYVGLHAQKSRNNIKSILLLLMFPILILVLVYAFFFILYATGADTDTETSIIYANISFVNVIPYVLLGVGVWFVIAYFANTYIIMRTTDSYTLSRKENKRVYNLVENLCMSQGVPMPKINVMDDNSLNAFASGINNKTYTITLSRGIINKLDDDELEGVIAHELSHIRNHDVRLLIISIVFVGIFALLVQVALRSLQFSSLRSSRDEKGGTIIVIVVALALAAVGYLFASIFKMAISRKREYLADASAAEMTKKPWALAGALRKVSQDSRIEAVKRADVAQLFIEHPGEESKKKRMGFSALFATHPPIEKRIKILEQFG